MFQNTIWTRLACPLVIVACSIGNTLAQSTSDYDVDPQTGLRMERYRAPVPADIPGGTTLSNDQALLRQRNGDLLFIDVYPPVGLGPDPIDGFWVTDETRESIPGAYWLPEVGRGTLTAEADDYFKRNLHRLTSGDLSTPVAFFCTSDCWQSWNAAKRAIAWGYTAVHWYPLGSDGWLEAGQSLTRVQPINFFDDTIPGDAVASTSDLFPASARILLIDSQGQETDIGSVQFTTPATASGDIDAVSFEVEIDSAEFEDQFLSMRPFRCLTSSAEWLCHLPYPYALAKTVTPDDLTALEYRLLFIWKSPSTFGIDAWNGLYYQLSVDDEQQIHGALLQGDLNVLADPPEPESRPIDLSEFTSEGVNNREFPTLMIRP